MLIALLRHLLSTLRSGTIARMPKRAAATVSPRAATNRRGVRRDATRDDTTKPEPGSRGLSSAAEIAEAIIEHHRREVVTMSRSPKSSLLLTAAPRVIETVKNCVAVLNAARPDGARGADDVAADVRAQVEALGPPMTKGT